MNMNVLPRAVARCASPIPRRTLVDVCLRPRCPRAQYSSTRAQYSAARAQYSTTGESKTSPAAPYTAYSFPKGGALSAAEPRGLGGGEAAVTLEAPRRAAPTLTSSGSASLQSEASSTPSQSTPSSTPSPAFSPTPSSTPPPTPSTTPKPRRTLRPRKAAVTLTPAAVSQLKALLDDPEPRTIRIGVRNKGCSGMAYHLEYVGDGERGRLDEEVVQDGVRVLVEGRALMSVIGSEMDWVEDRLSARFVFRNPNIKETCGCGESFNTH